MENLLLRPEEVAEMLGIGRSKVYELMADGRLTNVAIGRSRRVPREAVAEFVSRLTAEGVASGG